MPFPVVGMYGETYVDSVTRPVTRQFEQNNQLLAKALEFSAKARETKLVYQEKRAELAKLQEKPDTTPEKLLEAKRAVQDALEVAFVVAKMNRMASEDAEAAKNSRN